VWKSIGSRPIVTLLLATALTTATLQSALADNFSGPSGAHEDGDALCDQPTAINMTDNGTYQLYLDSVETYTHSAVNYSLGIIFEPRDGITTEIMATDAPNRDVVVRDTDYDTYCGFDWHPDGPDPRRFIYYWLIPLCDSACQPSM